MEPESKRKRVEAEACAGSGVKANDCLNLVFYESSIETPFSVKPTFTHQVFDHETILGLSNPSSASIDVSVCCSDLSTYVSFGSSITTEEQGFLLESLNKALPSDAVNIGRDDFKTFYANASNHDADSSTDAPISLISTFSPPGKRVHTFLSDGEMFEIWLATHHDPGADALLHKAEKMAIWFIETADGIDFSNEAWEVLFIFHVKQSPTGVSEPYFVGYFTLFTFRNPFKGSKLRICQALILPNMQGKGLGMEMILCVYRLARERVDVSEVTVEDPAPAFQRLRDAADCEWAVYVEEELKKCTSLTGSQPAASEPPLFRGDAGSCAHALKIISDQAYFVLEALRFCNLPNSKSVPVAGKVEIEDSAEFRKFRLDVKRRLNQVDREVAALPKERKVKKLEELFCILLERFAAVRKHRIRSSASRDGNKS